MELSAKKGIRQIVEMLAALGLQEVVLCPGSRNAPLVISFNRHPHFRCTSIRDERSAAFFAMGMAIELKRPVAVVSTSGSAALNFAPAISEAYYQRIPLIVITADRLKEWTDQGDGQTINQTDIYRNYICKSYDLRGDAEKDADFWYNNRSLNEGWNIATISDKGPVHFNIPLSEPLYHTTDFPAMPQRVFSEIAIERRLAIDTLRHLKDIFSGSRKVMILVGQHDKDLELQQALSKMASLDNVVVLTESTANIHDHQFIANIDRCITTLDGDEIKSYMPDLLITVGGAIVSKRIKAAIRKYTPKFHWNISLHHDFMDTYQCLSTAIPMLPVDFFRQFNIDLGIPNSDYRQLWQNRQDKLETLHRQFCEQCSYSDLAVFNQIFKQLPGNISVHIANSSPIRYAQLFDYRLVTETWCNRGTSGIDGCTSTAMGSAFAAQDKRFLMITGDVAFNYDINAFWQDHHIENLNIIVINNGGGGIFRIISGPDTIEEMEPYFETTMDTDARLVAERHGWYYMKATNQESLEKTLETLFLPETKKHIVEIFTEPKANPEVLKQYWDSLAK